MERRLKNNSAPHRKMGRVGTVILSCLAMIVATLAIAPPAMSAPEMINLGAYTEITTRPHDMNNRGQVIGVQGIDVPDWRGLFWDVGTTTPIDIGVLAGWDWTYPAHLNSHGLVVGECGPAVDYNSDSDAFFWDPAVGVIQNLTPPMASGSAAFRVNDLGVAVGTYWDSSAVNHAVLWDTAGGTYIDIGALIPGCTGSYGVDVNSMGHATGRYTVGGITHAYFWDGVAVNDLGPDLAGLRINDNDMICGESTTSNDLFFWDGVSATVTNIPAMGSPSHGMMIMDMNQAGTIVGEGDMWYDYGTGTHYGRAFCWSNGLLTDLDPWAGGTGRSRTTDINEFGVILGVQYGPGCDVGTWTPVEGGYQYTTIGEMPGYTGSSPCGLNDNGQIIGYSYDPVTPLVARAFLWKPDARPVASFSYEILTSDGPSMSVNVDGTASTDPDGMIVSYAWDFGDGSTGTGARATHFYAVAGAYTISLTITDDYGQIDVFSVLIDGSVSPESMVADLLNLVMSYDFSPKVEEDLKGRLTLAAQLLEVRKTGSDQEGGVRKTGSLHAVVAVLEVFDGLVGAYTVVGEINPGPGWDLTSKANLIIALLSYKVTIDAVPCYEWTAGCGPTAAGMLLGYWDGHGYPNLVDGDAMDWTSEGVQSMIASPEHYTDYARYGGIEDTPGNIVTDLSELGGAHEDNCLADFMHSSFSSEQLPYGVSLLNMVDIGLMEYTAWKSMGRNVGNCTILHQNALKWQDLQAEINAKRPLALMIDSNADGSTDHLVTVIGYCELGAARLYACWSTWDNTLWWANFDNMHKGNYFGFFAGMTFQMAWT